MASNLIIVESGCVEAFTTFEGNEFVLDRLYSGSIINFRSFFMEDYVYVNYRSQKYSKILELSLTKLNSIMNDHESFQKKMLVYQNSILKKNKKYPLDYLIKIPQIMRNRRISNTKFEQFM